LKLYLRVHRLKKSIKVLLYGVFSGFFGRSIGATIQSQQYGTVGSNSPQVPLRNCAILKKGSHWAKRPLGGGVFTALINLFHFPFPHLLHHLANALQSPSEQRDNGLLFRLVQLYAEFALLYQDSVLIFSQKSLHG